LTVFFKIRDDVICQARNTLPLYLLQTDHLRIVYSDVGCCNCYTCLMHQALPINHLRGRGLQARRPIREVFQVALGCCSCRPSCRCWNSITWTL